jgi:N-dimethylarginine dimethylaminohydrolase
MIICLMIKVGGHSEVLPLKTVLLKHPREAFLDQDTLNKNWKVNNYSACPDFQKALAEYEEFLKLLRKVVPDIRFLPSSAQTGMDSIYVRDAAVVTDQGLIPCRMGKELRQHEPETIESFAEKYDMPVLGRIEKPGRLEGGDVLWVDENTLAVGEGPRTNAEGIHQLQTLLVHFGIEVVSVPLPEWQDPRDVFHLMSIISPVDRKKAVIFPRLMPDSLQDFLLKKEFTLIDVSESEYATLACNILCLAPGTCLMTSGNPVTRRILEEQGIKVFEYDGKEISHKGGGGPTCLTRPILRS